MLEAVGNPRRNRWGGLARVPASRDTSEALGKGFLAGSR